MCCAYKNCLELYNFLICSSQEIASLWCHVIYYWCHMIYYCLLSPHNQEKARKSPDGLSVRSTWPAGYKTTVQGSQGPHLIYSSNSNWTIVSMTVWITILVLYYTHYISQTDNKRLHEDRLQLESSSGSQIHCIFSMFHILFFLLTPPHFLYHQ